jgi:hypothetical protein
MAMAGSVSLRLKGWCGTSGGMKMKSPATFTMLFFQPLAMAGLDATLQQIDRRLIALVDMRFSRITGRNDDLQ